jgi:hypothetical protein
MSADLIRFPCAECGKILGADPEMGVVICSRCRTENEVPARRAAARSLARAESEAVRIVAVDVPVGAMLWLGVKVAVAALPLVCLLAAAAFGVAWGVELIHDR